MLLIEYPPPSFRVREQAGLEYIFDTIRKRWLLLTPEEWVRQNFVQYLISVKKYPSTLIALEKEIMLGELTKRFDILVYNNKHQPSMMIECKAATIPINEKVLEQVLRYNITVPVEYIIITNGDVTYGWKRSEKGLVMLAEFPVYE